VSAFEMNIRFIGGFLSLHSLTGEKLFLNKAIEVADALLPVFNTPTGLPYALINIRQLVNVMLLVQIIIKFRLFPFFYKRKTVNNYHWASGGCTILSEAGTLILEFLYLSDASGNPVYKDKVRRIQTVLNEVEKENGLYYNYINPRTGKWCMSRLKFWSF
jgi:mannosyl-oligosaccharide alpha-1,2-mannosidase